MMRLQVFTLLVVVLTVPARLPAAEVHGEVALRHTGLFQGGDLAQVGEVSVSLEPGDGQSWPQSVKKGARTHRVVVKGEQLHPAYLTVRRGDSLEFENQDDVYHDLFALSPVQPISVYLGKAGQGGDAKGKVTLGATGSWHLFCGIHGRTYARVDAVESPLIQMVKPGEPFEFNGLQPGQWRMRVAALGTETRVIETVALTAPPVLHIDLNTRGGSARLSHQDSQPVQGYVEQLFPLD